MSYSNVATIYYDSDCGFCYNAAKLVLGVLRLTNVNLVPARNNNEIHRMLLKENSWVVVDLVTNKKYLRFEALLFLIRKSRFDFLYYFKYLPGIVFVGNTVYNIIGFFRSNTCTDEVESKKLNIILRNVASIFLGLLACLVVFGYVTKSSTLFSFGRSIGFAPLPLPFRDMGGAETMQRPKLTLIVDGNTRASAMDDFRILLHEGERSHHAIVPYYALINYGPAVPSRLRESILTYFCRSFLDAHHIYYSARYSASLAITHDIVCK